MSKLPLSPLGSWMSGQAAPASGVTAVREGLQKLSSDLFLVDLDGQLALEAQLQGQCGQTRDFKEGVVAFMEKRPPVYEGR